METIIVITLVILLCFGSWKLVKILVPSSKRR